jgi:hypothetical protein
MDETEMFSEIERLLLMAASARELGPSSSLVRANTAKVVEQALLWLGLSGEDIRQGWAKPKRFPINEEVYNVLNRMTFQFPDRAPERPGEVLFEGGGNWGVPGDPNCPAPWPQYNSCRLTRHGERIARLLLEQHPEYRKNP